MNDVFLHLTAAALSIIAMAHHRGSFYALLRPVMCMLGFLTAYNAWSAGETLVIVSVFIVSGLIFFVPLGPLWLVTNPAISLVYLAHLGWMSWTRFASASPAPTSQL